MTKKTTKKKVLKKTKAKSSANSSAAPVFESARDIWLAGLGAFSVAQAESGKLIEQGNKLFEKLVSEGKKLEKKTRDVADSAVGDLKGDVESKMGAVRKQAADNWDKLENIFEERVARVLGRLGVPTAEDIDKLSRRVQTLSRRVTELNTGGGAARATVKRKTTTKKKAAKSAAKPAVRTH
jgi:poly(hydroxyalkanoate) granule-associated protein